MIGTGTALKKQILPGFFVLLLLLPAGAQGTLRGEYSITGTGCLPGSTGYASPLNPENMADINDLTLQHRLSTRVAAGEGTAFIDLLIDLTPMTDPLSGSISPELFNLVLMRGAVSWYMGDGLKVTLGRQSLLTGYGYGWNPLDLANPLKDPSDPEADLAGVDGITVHLLPRLPLDLKLYGIADSEVSGSGVNYETVSLGAEASLIGTGIELKVTGLYRFDEEENLAGPKGSLGAGIFTDIGGAGLYAEASLRDRSRTLFVQPGGDLATKPGPVFTALGGTEYTFPGGLFVTAEYFYNGEGYSREERQAIVSALEDTGLLTELLSGNDQAAAAAFTALTELYRPGYFSRHYGLVSLLYPLYDQNIDLSGTLLYSFDAGTLALQPRILWYASGGLTLEAAYGGLFDLGGDEAGEAALAPVKHAISVTGRFSF